MFVFQNQTRELLSACAHALEIGFVWDNQMWQRTFSLIILYSLHSLSPYRFLFLCRITTTRNYFMGKFVLITYCCRFNWAMKKAARAFSHELNQQPNEIAKKKTLFSCTPKRAFDVAADELLQAPRLRMALFCVVFSLCLAQFRVPFPSAIRTQTLFLYWRVQPNYTPLNAVCKSISIFGLCIWNHPCPPAHLAKQ